MAAKSKYVVLAGSIGNFCSRGDVVDQAFFFKHGCDEDRVQEFVAQGTVREASNLEAPYDKVDLDNESTTLTVESRLAAANRRIEAMAKENAELQSELQAVKAAKAPVTGPPDDAKRYNELMAKKDAIITELQQKLKNAEDQKANKSKS